MYIDKPLREYLDDLAARKPAPGGGSAAALAAATGVSLMSMVLNYTIGNAKYKEREKEAADMLVKVEKAKQELQDLIDEDVQAYEKLTRGMKEAGKDASKNDSLFKDAATPPFEMCKLSAEALKMCSRLVAIGNKNLVTDTAIAALMLESAFLSAKFNVYINLKYIKDMDFIGMVHKTLAPLEEELPKLKEDILEKCEDVIAK